MVRIFPCSSVGKESACNAGDLGSIPGSGRSPGKGNGNSLQYSCLENPMDRGAWWAIVHTVTRVEHDWSDLAAAWYFFVNSLSFLCKCPLAFLLSFILFLFTVLRVAFMFYESEVTQSCPTLCDPLDCSLPGFSVHGILQARKLEWVTISFSRGSSWPRDWTQVSRITGRRFNLWATREAPMVTVTKALF